MTQYIFLSPNVVNSEQITSNTNYAKKIYKELNSSMYRIN